MLKIYNFWNRVRGIPNSWFQQDGATSHTTVECLHWLKETFQNRLISHKSEFPWPPRSPDLSPLDFFLWGFLKEVIFKRKPVSVPKLKDFIVQTVATVEEETLQNAMENFVMRIHKCMAENGGHFDHLS